MKKIYFETRLRASEGTEDHYLIEYLRTRGRAVKDTVWATAKDHWLALAYHGSGEYGREEVIRQGLLSVGALRAQIRYIKEVLGLEDEIDSAVVALVAELEKRSPATGVATFGETEPVAGGDPEPEPAVPTYDDNLF